ncbi:hypothetical protein P8452_08389 [Trifolium repens]|nr:hypothetical protein QL285_051303 [Trifolium repens]WJX18607.1 hypothetical protein P8452_08389 [Trifolium repens]
MAYLRSNGSNSRFQMSGSFSSSLKRDGDVIPDCRCGFKAVICTVTKKEPNRGRKFWDVEIGILMMMKLGANISSGSVRTKCGC